MYGYGSHKIIVLNLMIPIVDQLEGIPGSGGPVEDSDLLRSLPRSVRPVELTIQDH